MTRGRTVGTAACAAVAAALSLAVVGCGVGEQIGVVKQEVAEIHLAPDELSLPAGATYTLAAEARSKNGVKMKDVELDWRVSSGVGGITREGVFTATERTSSDEPATGTITASYEEITASIPVTVHPGAVSRVVIEAPADESLDDLKAGSTYRLTAYGEDEFGNVRGGRARLVVTALWSVADEELARIDANGKLLCLEAGTVEVTATVGEVTGEADVQVRLPSGVSDSQGVLLEPGGTQTVSTKSGFKLTADDAVSEPTLVVVQEESDPYNDVLTRDTLTLDGPAVSIHYRAPDPAKPLAVFLPDSTSTRQLGTVSYPLIEYTHGADRFIYVPLTTQVEKQADGWWVQFGHDLAAAIGGAATTARFVISEAPLGQYVYQLAPLSAWDQAAEDAADFRQGYGLGDAHTGEDWPTTGRVAVVVHGINARPGVWLKAQSSGGGGGGGGGWRDQAVTSFDRFLRNNLGYDHVWAFHYMSWGRIASNAAVLQTIIEPLFGTDQKVDFFCHSMGGLVVRHWLEQLGDTGHVERVVTLGTPHLGSGLAHPGATAAWPNASVWSITEAVADIPDSVLDSLGYGAVSLLKGGATDGAQDLIPAGVQGDSGFLSALNQTGNNGQGRIQPVYFLLGGNLEGLLPSSGYVYQLEWLGYKWFKKSELEDTIEKLRDKGDGVVLTASSLDEHLWDEAYGYLGVGGGWRADEQPIDDFRQEVEGVSHDAYATSQAVRDKLLDWWRNGTTQVTINRRGVWR